jgi:hypothetical protein
MKNFILGLFILGLTNLTSAQHDLAMETTSNLNVYSSKSSKIQNQHYLNLRFEVAPALALSIKSLQDVAADYDITEDDVYSKNERITYMVVFESNANYIKAVYDHNSDILKSVEYYEDVRIPTPMATEIAQSYPGWSFYKSNCIIEYTQNEATRFTYSLVLKKGTKTKTVKRTL